MMINYGTKKNCTPTYKTFIEKHLTYMQWIKLKNIK
jgi:hypothetical protein